MALALPLRSTLRRWPLRDAAYWWSSTPRATSLGQVVLSPPIIGRNGRHYATQTDESLRSPHDDPLQLPSLAGATIVSNATLPDATLSSSTTFAQPTNISSRPCQVAPPNEITLQRRLAKARRLGPMLAIQRLEKLVLLNKKNVNAKQANFETAITSVQAYLNTSDNILGRSKKTFDIEATNLLLAAKQSQEETSLIKFRETYNCQRQIVFEKQTKLLRHALYLFLRNPLGLPYAGRICDLMVKRGIRPSVTLMTTLLKRTVERLLLTRGKRHIEDTRKSVFELVQHVLSVVPQADMYLFSLTAAFHIRLGTPIQAIEQLVKDCMRSNGRGDVSQWTPEAFDAIMAAHRRDEDLKGCERWYGRFREATPVDMGESRQWPYVTMLHATQELSPRHGLASTSILKRRTDAMISIVSDMREDGLTPPIDIYNSLLTQARRSDNFRAGEDVWQLLKKGNEGIPPPNIETYIQYIRLMHVRNKTFPLGSKKRSNLRTILAGMDLKMVRGSSPAKQADFLHQVIMDSMAKYQKDFPLALWALQQYRANDLFIAEKTIDAIGSSMLQYWVYNRMTPAWSLEVMGKQGLDLLKILNKIPLLPARYPMQMKRRKEIRSWHWEIVSKRLIDLAGAQDTKPVSQLPILPLTRPMAQNAGSGDTPFNLDEEPTPFKTSLPPSLFSIISVYSDGRTNAGEITTTYQTGAEELIRRCIVADAKFDGDSRANDEIVAATMGDIVVAFGV